MEVALRRRLEGVATIAISQQQQTAEVVFAPGQHVFAPAEFRAAVEEADVEVLSFEVEACGRVEQDANTRWFVAGLNRFVVSDGSLSRDGPACVSAALDDGREPHQLGKVQPIAALRKFVTKQECTGEQPSEGPRAG